MFAKFYTLIAALVLAIGTLRVIIGFQLVDGTPEVIARYLGSSPGEAVDKGVYTILIGLTMLLIAKIAISVEKLVDKK